MTLKHFTRTFRRAVARYVLYFCTWVAQICPYGVMRAIGYVLKTLGKLVLIKHKHVARDSLRIAFENEKSLTERENILSRCFDNIIWNMMEICYFNSHPKQILGKIELRGQEHLDQALKKGKGVVALTAHFGNFPMMMFYLASLGYKPNVILRALRDEKAEQHIAKTRDRYGLQTIYAKPRGQCITKAMRALRRGELLFILGDQNFGSGTGVFVDFFGHKAATAVGPLVFAKRTGAEVVPLFIRRTGRDSHIVEIMPAMELNWTDDSDKDMTKYTQQFTNQIEEYIRQYPEEWGWMHKRWKSRPRQESETTRSKLEC